MNNILIVESENDKFFIEAVIKHINVNVEIREPVCSVNEYDCIGGMSKLEKRLESLTHRIMRGEIDKVGIVFDADKIGVEKRTEQIEEKIGLMKATLPEEFREINFTIYIQNKDGYGELETVLKEIKSKDSKIADCLESWQNCIEVDKKLTQKELDKVWVQMYQRYDNCTNNDKKQADRKCNNEISFSKDMYNLDNPILKDLIEFLKKLGRD